MSWDEWTVLGREWTGDGWRVWYEYVVYGANWVLVAIGVTRTFPVRTPFGHGAP